MFLLCLSMFCFVSLLVAIRSLKTSFFLSCIFFLFLLFLLFSSVSFFYFVKVLLSILRIIFIKLFFLSFLIYPPFFATNDHIDFSLFLTNKLVSEAWILKKNKGKSPIKLRKFKIFFPFKRIFPVKIATHPLSEI